MSDLTLLGIFLIMPGAIVALFLGMTAYVRRLERIDRAADEELERFCSRRLR